MGAMNEFFFADVDLPFHVWVRERAAGTGFRWVLRKASQSQESSVAPGEDAGTPEAPPASKGLA